MKHWATVPQFALPTFYSLPTSITVVLHDTGSAPPRPTAQPVRPQTISELATATSRLHHLRDGEVVLYRVPSSRNWQARYKTQTGHWLRFSTRKRRLDDASRIACERYDEARFRERMGLAPAVKRFEEIARVCVADMTKEMAAGHGKRVFTAYIGVIERYLVPYFGQRYLSNISHKDVTEFEIWRNQQMKRPPKASTLLTFSSAFSRIHQTAIARGWISDRVPIPKLTVKGEKGTARPAFTAEEIALLRDHLLQWHAGVDGKTGEMRRLLRDYVDVLFLTGMRQGTESMNLRWKHIEWHTDAGRRYLRIWVSGKTGPRWLIAKHECVAALLRLHRHQPDLARMDFETLIASRSEQLVFRFENGEQPYEFNHVFRRLLQELGIEKSPAGTNRTLYSLRHTYATLELLAGTDIHTLAKQMGTSVVMLERHYSKLTATLAAEQLA
ncbi:tyrosine-type recombinase/integrase [Hydrogenophaga defluvii]|uniref:Tyrosine-type recombinase/integrase n=2 Tax=Hydrogenophaga defluvii TaxID=249410 RepID=A0ABW2SDE7_9BURK